MCKYALKKKKTFDAMWMKINSAFHSHASHLVFIASTHNFGNSYFFYLT